MRKLKTKTPVKLLDLEIDKDARALLRDYASLACRRPFLSLAAVMAPINGDSAPLNLIGAFSGAFGSMDIGATLVALRDNLSGIDREAMREIISYSEANIRNIFLNPSKVRRV